MTITSKQPICFNCKHFNLEESTCPAFDGDIPDEIIFGDNDHTKPIDGQNGKIVYEKKGQ